MLSAVLVLAPKWLGTSYLQLQLKLAHDGSASSINWWETLQLCPSGMPYSAGEVI